MGMNVRIKWVEDAMFLGETQSGHAMVMDGPLEGGGRNLGPRPMEMLLLGLGGCTAYDVVSILKKSRQPIIDCEVVITAERADSAPKVFTKIHVYFRVKAKPGVKDAQVKRAVDLTAEKYCSASIMLSKAVAITHAYEIQVQE